VAALQGVAANHRKVRRSRAGVLSVAGKGETLILSGVGQEGERERTPDEVPKCFDDIETEEGTHPRDEAGGYLFTALAVSGIKGARAWLRRWCGTWEPVVPIVRSVQLDFWSPWPEEGELQAEATARGRVPSRSTGTDRLVVAMKAL